MPPEEDIREAANALGGSIVVCGVGDYRDSAATRSLTDTRFVPISQLDANEDENLAAVVIGVDPTALGDGSLSTLAALDAFTVGVVPESVANRDLSALREAVDAVLIASGADSSADGVERAVRAFLTVVQDPGFVNLDLTDAETVLASGIAALGTGTATRDTPSTAVELAFEALPSGVDATDASAVLVDVTLDPVTSITAATDVIAAVRDRVGTDANIIWGGAVDESVSDGLIVRIVVADVQYSRRPDVGDPCPRCDAPLSSYALGASQTLACDSCEYSGIAIRRE